MSRRRGLLQACRGSATIEFALTSLYLFGTLMVALDFGFYAQQKLRLGSAVEQAAVLAFNTQSTAAISTYIQNYAGTKATPTVTVTCNGTATCGDGRCSCVTSSGGFTTPGACNTACSGSSAVSGNYVKIVAATTYAAVIVPNAYLGGGTLTQSAVVRLQ